MNIEIKINTDNDAFDDGNLKVEVDRILKDYIINKSSLEEWILKDINGNTVGCIEFWKN